MPAIARWPVAAPVLFVCVVFAVWLIGTGSGTSEGGEASGSAGAPRPAASTYLSITGGMMVSNAEWEKLRGEMVGDEPAPGVETDAAREDALMSAVRSLQTERSAELARLVEQAGFDKAVPRPNPAPLFDCIESGCASLTPSGVYMLVTIGDPLVDAPDVAGAVVAQSPDPGSPNRVLPNAMVFEYGRFRRSVLDDPVAQDKVEALRALITPDVAKRLSISPDLIRLDLAIFPEA